METLLENLRQRLVARLPDATISAWDGGDHPDGWRFLDISVGEKRVVVQASRTRCLGVSLLSDDPLENFGDKPDETFPFDEEDRLVERTVALLSQPS